MNKQFFMISALLLPMSMALGEPLISTPVVPFPVRVLLDEFKVTDQVALTICSPQGFVIEDCEDPEMFEECLETTLTLSKKGDALTINGRNLKVDRVSIRPREGALQCGKYSYAGTFIFMQTVEKVYLINSVDLEEYLFSVLRWEGWPGWPDEVNKVFAVMCRTYVVNKLLLARRLEQPYDIKKSNLHQTYNGLHEHEHLWRILEGTRGLVMVHNGQVIEAMYDACCGGVIPGKVSGYNFEAAPYLKRMKPCVACKETKLYSWQAEYRVTDFQDIISKEFGKKLIVLDVQVSKKDKAGVVQELKIKTKSGVYTLKGKRIYALFKRVKSLTFDITKKDNKIIFKNGRGYGHHMGVCQWGVRQKVREGKEHLDILKDYYVGISFMNIQIIEGV